jgi:hypothetical protein
MRCEVLAALVAAFHALNKKELTDVNHSHLLV